MIDFKISLALPDEWSKGGWYREWNHKLSLNKSVAVEAQYRGWPEIFVLDINTQWTGCDHAGVRFALTVLGFNIGFRFYDSRHWDTENNRWTVYDEAYHTRMAAHFERDRQAEIRRARRLIAKEDAKEGN